MNLFSEKTFDFHELKLHENLPLLFMNFTHSKKMQSALGIKENKKIFPFGIWSITSKTTIFYLQL